MEPKCSSSALKKGGCFNKHDGHPGVGPFCNGQIAWEDDPSPGRGHVQAACGLRIKRSRNDLVLYVNHAGYQRKPATNKACRLCTTRVNKSVNKKMGVDIRVGWLQT